MLNMLPELKDQFEASQWRRQLGSILESHELENDIYSNSRAVQMSLASQLQVFLVAHALSVYHPSRSVS